MSQYTRRHFLKAGSSFALAAVVAPDGVSLSSAAVERKFKLCLNPGAIGVSATQESLLDMAVQHGYEAIIAMPDQLAEFSEGKMSDYLGAMNERAISWGSSNLPVDFRKDEATFREGLEALKKQAPALERAGAHRMNTWIMPSHDELTYNANFQRHAERLRACARILEDHDVRLGLEYVGPKTLLTRARYPFLRTMAEARELIAEIGTSNMGLVLDSFHWYCAEDTKDDILQLSDKDIVTCDLNDARSDLSRDEQIDGTRELPGATGVIDLKAFLSALVEVGYTGPVRAEPFNQPLRDTEDQKALAETYEAMRKAFGLVE